MGSEARFKVHVNGHVGDAVAAAAAPAVAGIASAGQQMHLLRAFPFMEMVHLLVPTCLEKSQLIWAIFGN